MIMDAVASPARYGFGERTVLDACCAGGGPYNGNFTVHCSEPGAVLCPDPSVYVSWDGLHFSTSPRPCTRSWHGTCSRMFCCCEVHSDRCIDLTLE